MQKNNKIRKANSPSVRLELYNNSGKPHRSRHGGVLDGARHNSSIAVILVTAQVRCSLNFRGHQVGRRGRWGRRGGALADSEDVDGQATAAKLVRSALAQRGAPLAASEAVGIGCTAVAPAEKGEEPRAGSSMVEQVRFNATASTTAGNVNPNPSTSYDTTVQHPSHCCCCYGSQQDSLHGVLHAEVRSARHRRAVGRADLYTRKGWAAARYGVVAN